MHGFGSPNDKKALRQGLLHIRNSLTMQEVASKSHAINERVLSLDLFQKAQYPFIYVSIGNEVQTGRLISTAIEMGKHVSVPVTLTEEKRMVAAHISSVDNLVETGKLRLKQPRAGTYEIVQPNDIDLVIAPGIVFDERGRRIGYGGGYYDRFLPLICSSTLIIGLAYELQIVYNIPVEEHDRVVDVIVSEERVIFCKTDKKE